MGDLYSQIPPLNLGTLVKPCVSKGEREEKDWGSKTETLNTNKAGLESWCRN